MQVGSIVKIFAPTAGYKKYHLCLKVADEQGVAKFVFINSDPGFKDLYVVDDHRIPCLPASPTGKSCFSFSMLVRLSDHQLKIFNSEELGVIDYDLAVELQTFAANIRSLNKADLALVLSALGGLVQALEP